MPAAIEPETLKKIDDLQTRGRNLDAWELLQSLEPPEQWPEAAQRMSAVRLLERLGAVKRARQMIFREWRRRETRHEAREEMFWEVLRSRGALLAWQWLESHPPDDREGDEGRRDHLGYQGYVMTRLRDYDRAETYLTQGIKQSPNSRWFSVLRADLLESQDRREEALVVLKEVLAKDPGYSHAISDTASLLSDLQRDDEAVAILKQGLESVQSGQLAAKLASLLIELDRFAEAEDALALYEKYSPLREMDAQEWLWGRRCDIASHRGDQAAALHWAEQVQSDGFYKRVAAKLKSAQGELRRNILPVPFVRQNDVTCAPASVTSIAHFWGHDVAHLDLADEICYDGTPDYRQRQWAEENGWISREFRVTVDAAKQLIDAGMPFVLNTVYPGGAHAQVVIGYDEFRTVLFIRDPGSRSTTEFLAEEALKEQAPFGPRGFVMVPPPEADKLHALALPDAEIYELTHAVSGALFKHDRVRATEVIEMLRRDWPDHLLRWHGELSLSRYDGNHSHTLRCLEEMLKLHPHVVNWQTERMHMLREVHGYEAVIASLRAACADAESHPILWRMLARELQQDERYAPEVQRWLTRVHRQRLDSAAILAQAHLHWARREWPKATEVYRVASCLEPRNQGLAMSYFNAAVWTGQTETALSLLRKRFEDNGHLSGQPASTLAGALEQLNRTVETLAVLEESLRKRPEDADHALHVAGEFATWGRVEQARAILASTPQKARAAAWHRVQARLAQKAGDHQAQLEHWQAVVADQPMDNDAHRSIAWQIELREGAAAAIAYIRSVCARFPFRWQLHLTLLDWARPEGPDLWEEAARELVRIDPADAWAHRELADALRAGEKFAEAHAALDHSAALAPMSPSLHAVRAAVFSDEGKSAEAQSAWRQALKMDVDTTAALKALISHCRTQEQRQEELRFVQEELKRQTTSGDGVLAFAQAARPYLEADQLLAFLREGHQARPDLWQTGVMLVEHLRNTGAFEEAAQIARSLTDRFPLMPRAWMELGLCLEGMGLRHEAIEAVSRVREQNPGWGWGMITLSEMIRKNGDYAGSRAVLEQGLRFAPRNARLHGYLADVLWHLGEKTDTIDHLKQAVEIDPGYGWAWDRLGSWGEVAGRPEAKRHALDRLLSERPAEARTWILQAESLTKPNQLEERLAALDKAIECDPEAWRPVDDKAMSLTLAGRFELALQICRGHPRGAVQLRIREAWVLNKKGRYSEAVEVMDAALRDDPGQLWGWQLLVEWHQKQDKLDLAEAALRQVSRLQPAEAVHLGYLAQIQLARKNDEGARASLEKSLEVEPDYLFGIFELFNLNLRERNFDGAIAVIERARPHLTSLQYQTRRFIINCRLHAWGLLPDCLSPIFSDPEDDEVAFDRVAAEFKVMPARVLKNTEQQTLQALQSGNANVNVASLYVRCRGDRGKFPNAKFLNGLPPAGESGIRAVLAYLEVLISRWRSGHKTSEGWFGLRESWRLRWLLKQHRPWLHAEPRLYGKMSYVLHSMERHRQTTDWLADWREREHLEPYMLNNLTVSLQVQGRDAEAAEVVARGVALTDHNECKMRFHIWAALERALDQNEAEARALLDAVDSAALDSYGKTLWDLTQIPLLYQPGESQPPAFSEEMRETLTKFMKDNRENRCMRRAIRRICGLAGRRLGTRQPVLWFWWKRWGIATVSVAGALLLYLVNR